MKVVLALLFALVACAVSSPVWTENQLEREIRDYLEKRQDGGRGKGPGPGKGPGKDQGPATGKKPEAAEQKSAEEDEDDDETEEHNGSQEKSGGNNKGNFMAMMIQHCGLQVMGQVSRTEFDASAENLRNMIKDTKEAFDKNEKIMEEGEKLEDALREKKQAEAIEAFREIGKDKKGLKLLCMKLRVDILLFRLKTFGAIGVKLGPCLDTCKAVGGLAKQMDANSKTAFRDAIRKDHKCIADNLKAVHDKIAPKVAAKVEAERQAAAAPAAPVAEPAISPDDLAKLSRMNANINGIIHQGFVFHACVSKGLQIAEKGSQGEAKPAETKPAVRELLKALRELVKNH